MPGAKTYQAIGYATYHGGRFWSRAKRAELERQMHRRRQVRGAAAAAVGLGALVLVAGLAARRGDRVPSV